MTQNPESSVTEAAELVAIANRVLVARGVLDAYGHVSMRNPENPDSFLLARNLAPALVTATDVLLYDLDSQTSDQRAGYLERFIHGEIYRLHPEVNAVVHSHSASMIPFSISEIPLRAVWHMAGFLGERTPVFEIRDVAGTESDLLIRNRELGASLATRLTGAAVMLMRGHGSVAVGSDVPQVVHRAVYAELNARAQAGAALLGSYTSLTAQEAAAAAESNNGQIRRAWEIWRSEVEDRK